MHLRSACTAYSFFYSTLQFSSTPCLDIQCSTLMSASCISISLHFQLTLVARFPKTKIRLILCCGFVYILKKKKKKKNWLHAARRWDKERPATVDNLVLLTFGEAEQHEEMRPVDVKTEDPDFFRRVQQAIARVRYELAL